MRDDARPTFLVHAAQWDGMLCSYTEDKYSVYYRTIQRGGSKHPPSLEAEVDDAASVQLIDPEHGSVKQGVVLLKESSSATGSRIRIRV